MRYLLDTCTLLWALNDVGNLPKNIQKIINDYDNEIWVSDASIWEIEIKHQKNSELMPYTGLKVYNVLLISGFKSIDIRVEQIFQLGDIIKQNIHNDPFDHLILATAKDEKMTLITHDSLLSKYEGINVITY